MRTTVTALELVAYDRGTGVIERIHQPIQNVATELEAGPVTVVEPVRGWETYTHLVSVTGAHGETRVYLAAIVLTITAAADVRPGMTVVEDGLTG